ncbi:MAG: 4Fe-4S binding protein [Candidatus Verstraetearchaeota archaeon]|nr:4Fe-4S binding protein [Candidatus Verstraetearchaeota archaeon]
MFPKKSPKVTIDYTKCGEKGHMDPRDCAKCLRVCDPAIFILHESPNMPIDPVDPKYWRITPVWLSLCNMCMKCVKACPLGAITVSR